MKVVVTAIVTGVPSEETMMSKKILLSALRTKRATGEYIDDDKTISDIIDSMTEEQKNALYYIVGKLMNAKENEGDDE